jgi:DNA-binding NtrC family response regulator
MPSHVKKESIVVALSPETQRGQFHTLKLGRVHNYVFVASLGEAFVTVLSGHYPILLIETSLIPSRGNRPLPSDFHNLLQRQPQLKILLIISQDSHRQLAVRLLREGAFDSTRFPYFTTEVRKMLSRAVTCSRLQNELETARSLFSITKPMLSLPDATNALQKILIMRALQRNMRLPSAAAEELGIPLKTLTALMRRLEIPRFRVGVSHGPLEINIDAILQSIKLPQETTRAEPPNS